jgi:hypothetical protein
MKALCLDKAGNLTFEQYDPEDADMFTGQELDQMRAADLVIDTYGKVYGLFWKYEPQAELQLIAEYEVER